MPAEILQLFRGHLIVFGAMAVLDFVWAEYNKACARGRLLYAPAMSSVIILLSGFTIRSFVEDASFLLTCALGAFVGTFLSMRYGSKH